MVEEQAGTSRAGRKRDPGRTERILDAALIVLAENGYEAMTIDMVAARAHAARATVYRRWATKADLVVAAVGHLGRSDVDPGHLPDTGTLRGDLLAMIRPDTFEEQQMRIRVMTSLLSLADVDPRFARAATSAGGNPWTAAIETILRRAVERGEFPSGDIATLAEVLPMMSICRVAFQRRPITREFSIALIDGVLLPALRGGSDPNDIPHTDQKDTP